MRHSPRSQWLQMTDLSAVVSQNINLSLGFEFNHLLRRQINCCRMLWTVGTGLENMRDHRGRSFCLEQADAHQIMRKNFSQTRANRPDNSWKLPSRQDRPVDFIDDLERFELPFNSAGHRV